MALHLYEVHLIPKKPAENGGSSLCVMACAKSVSDAKKLALENANLFPSGKGTEWKVDTVVEVDNGA